MVANLGETDANSRFSRNSRPRAEGLLNKQAFLKNSAGRSKNQLQVSLFPTFFSKEWTV